MDTNASELFSYPTLNKWQLMELADANAWDFAQKHDYDVLAEHCKNFWDLPNSPNPDLYDTKERFAYVNTMRKRCAMYQAAIASGNPLPRPQPIEQP